MKKSILIALIAATALAPIAATAQERQGRRGGGQAQSGGADRQRPVFTGNGGGQAVDRSAFRAQRMERRAAAATPSAPAAVQSQNRGERREFRNERRDDRQDFNRERRDDRQDFRQERRQDRSALQNGTVTRDQFRNDRRDDRQDFNRDRRDDRQDYRTDRRDDRRDYRNDRGRAIGNGNWTVRNRDWNRSWRSDRRYNWQDWRSRNRNAYRLPRYYAPRGYHYGYQRFGIGVTLGSILFSQNYWISDPWAYRLPPADGPYRWVRYYNDALLVDIHSGEVVDVINDIFW